jgi:hypothetical protein
MRMVKIGCIHTGRIKKIFHWGEIDNPYCFYMSFIGSMSPFSFLYWYCLMLSKHQTPIYPPPVSFSWTILPGSHRLRHLQYSPGGRQDAERVTGE